MLALLDPALDDEALWARLPSLGDDELVFLPDHPSSRERHIVRALKRAALPAAFFGHVLQSRWVQAVQVQLALVNHPQTPRGDALNLVKFLPWRALNLAMLNVRIAPEVRHLAESFLLQRLQSMAIGEKMTLARMTAGQPLKALRTDKDPRVIRALLENPRLVEEDVLFLVSFPRCPAPVLEVIARDPKWNTRREMRVALLRNSSTPLSVALSFVTSLTVPEVRGLVHDPKVPLAVRRALQRRLGESR